MRSSTSVPSFVPEARDRNTGNYPTKHLAGWLHLQTALCTDAPGSASGPSQLGFIGMAGFKRTGWIRVWNHLGLSDATLSRLIDRRSARAPLSRDDAQRAGCQ